MGLATVCALLLIFGPATAVCRACDASGASAAPRPQTEKGVGRITAAQLGRLISDKSPVTIVDVRLPKHYESGRTKVKGALRIAPADLAWRLDEIPRHRQIILYCACPDEATSLRLGARLREAGYKDVSVLKGGWDGWVQAGGQQEPK